MGFGLEIEFSGFADTAHLHVFSLAGTDGDFRIRQVRNDGRKLQERIFGGPTDHVE